MRADLRGDDDLPVYRIEFHRVDDPTRARCWRRAPTSPPPTGPSSTGASTGSTGRPSTGRGPGPRSRSSPGSRAARAADLAAWFGRETQPFKTDVRKLKNLGLTESLEVGYRLSPRGEAYLGGES